MEELRVQRLNNEATLPFRANHGDLGYDLFASVHLVIEPGAMKPVPTGVALQFPDGWGGIIKDRSSMAMKRITVSAGVIDSGYRGEVKILLTNGGAADFVITPGEKIAQMVPVPVTPWDVVETDDLSDSDRGTGGFGSTD